MFGSMDIVLVTLISIGASVVVGVLGYLIDKSGEPANDDPQGERR